MELTIETIAEQTTTLSQSAYRALRTAIVTLRLKPGTMVSESELASSLEVSRTPIREAIRMLLSDDLIQVLPQRGIRIAFISRKKVEEAVFVRKCLEISAFREVARNFHPSKTLLDALRRDVQAILELQRRAYAEDDIGLFLEADDRFHHKILEQAENQTLLNVVFSMSGHLTRARYLALKELKRFPAIMKEHQELLRHVTSHREEQAAQLINRHLDHLLYQLPDLVIQYPDLFRP